jgi:NADH-quinone oxidoreductase subunit N
VDIAAFEPAMFLAVLPEIALIVLAVLVLVLDLVWQDRENGNLGWLTAGGMLVAALLGVIFSQPGAHPALILGGMLSQDWTTFVFRLLFLLGGGLTALIATDRPSKHYGEFCALLIISVLGMNLMAASANLVMLYLAIETTSLPLYILAGFKVLDQKSVEAGIKYLLFGAMASAVMLYGFSLIWGFTGEMGLDEIKSAVQAGSMSPLVVAGTLVLVLVGFGFKISAVPFHFWAPDVYEGAPAPVAGFLSTASKAAGFAVLVRFLLVVVPSASPFWSVVIGILAVASMIVGNFMALTQRNIKRLLAYSSIAQAGYILVGIAANNALGISGVVYYLTSYLVTNIAAFAIVWLVGREVGSDDLDAYAGLAKRNPGIALVMLSALLSLGGIPPLSGFVGKLLVFGAAVQAGLQGQPWLIGLASVGVATSIVGLYYYLNVMKIMYKPGKDENAIPLATSWKLALAISTIGMFALGIVIAPWFGWSWVAAMRFF